MNDECGMMNGKAQAAFHSSFITPHSSFLVGYNERTEDGCGRTEDDGAPHARRRGHVLNVASTAAFQPGPLMAVYYASKAYVLSLSEALSNETAGTGVTVTVLCPGPTGTGFVAAAGMEESKLFDRGAMTARA